jgi:hypothetical protein
VESTKESGLATSGILRKLVWIFSSLAVVGVLLAIALWPTGEEEWEAMSGRINRLKAEARTRKFPRSIFKGEPSRGNAWEEYDVALDEAAKWTEAQNGLLITFLQKGVSPADRVKVEQIVAAHQDAVEHLRRGAQRPDGQYAYSWERVGEMRTPPVRDLRRLANGALAQAKVWADSGRTQDAADLLFDVSAFARDIATNGTLLTTMVGFSMHEIVTEQLGRLVQSGKLTPSQLDELSKKLETVDREFPTLRSPLSNETMALGIYLVKAADGGPLSMEWRETVKIGGMRFAMASQSLMREAYEIEEGFLKRSVKLDELPFAAVRKETDAISAETRVSSNSVVQFITPNLLNMSVSRRKALTQLRLVRTGAAFVSTGTIPVLDDPFGDKLLHKQDGRTLKVWSIGTDGKNNNGTETKPGGPDIVFEISK